ncbi:hypothetical protein AB1399_02155 [Hydrogenibacillus schlegelii]|uniref:hypothetical protein n=1 Tax=Hydrogenibacillus schlegelii TaxID=1484 RepID=UPI001FE1C939|nr:hypothetical protein [Hydrogenibacillus schlegelii]
MFRQLNLKQPVIPLILFAGGLASLLILENRLSGASSLVTSPSTEGDLVAVQQTVARAIEARWQLIVDPQANIKQFYDVSTSEQEENRERAYVRRHYLEPASRAGFQYTNVKVHPVFEGIEIDGKSAKVRALVSVEYESVFPGSNEAVITKEANIPYLVTLTKRNGQWLIVRMNSQDTYSKRAQESGLIIRASGLEALPTSKIAGSDVGIQGF